MAGILNSSSKCAEFRGNIKMEEFIKVLTEQIRCVKARDGVAKEYRNHINDQAECYEQSGMSHEEAIQAAVKEMGDPVAVGMELDHIHRPRTDWKMLLMAVLFSIAGIMIQYVTGVLDIGHGRLGNQCLYIIIGLLAMLGIYFLDYSFIGKYTKLIYWGMLIVYFVYTNLWAETINGQARGMVMPLYLFVPVYAGILYQYRGQGYKAVVKSIFYMIPVLFFSWCLIPSMPTAVNLLFIMNAMLLLAVWKEWFRLDKIKTILCLAFAGVVFPICAFVYLYYFKMADYQKLRIQSIFHILDGTDAVSFVNQCAKIMITESKWIGTSVDIADSNYQLMQSNGFILTQLMASYGVLFGVIVVLAFIMLLSHMFRITWKQKNQLGFMIGAGCGLIFLVAIIEGIFVNIGWFPSTLIHIPFLTYGKAATINYDILIGLLLSIYRYQNVVNDKVFKTKWKISMKIEKTMKE